MNQIKKLRRYILCGFRCVNVLVFLKGIKILQRIFYEKKEAIVVCYESHSGLCDRLKAIVSLYSVCKQLSIPFKIHHKKPFELTEFLEPNSYDWTLKEEKSLRKSLKVNSCLRSCAFERFYTKKYFYDQFSYPIVEQFDVRCNAHLIQDGMEFSHLFHELFRPTKIVQDQINYYSEIIRGGGYISVSSRFAGLIGDFNETYNQPLPKKDREILLNSCLAQIEKMHGNFPDMKILVCSDSITFLRMASNLDYVIIIDGEPVHEAKTNLSDIKTHLKTFVDFFMIAGAEKVFLLLSGKMYNSGFPYVAALVNNREFEIVRF